MGPRNKSLKESVVMGNDAGALAKKVLREIIPPLSQGLCLPLTLLTLNTRLEPQSIFSNFSEVATLTLGQVAPNTWIKVVAKPGICFILPSFVRT